MSDLAYWLLLIVAFGGMALGYYVLRTRPEDD